MTGVSEKPGRYQRSTNGLIGALLVTLLAVGGFVLVRSLVRADLEVEQEPVDYAAAAEAARDAGFDVVAPTKLPTGWRATSIDLSQSRPPTWGIGILTDEGRFVGLRQTGDSVLDVVADNVDEEAVEGETVTLDSAVGDSWTTWTDEGGDTGYSTEYDEQSLLVYGSAAAEDLETLIGLLED